MYELKDYLNAINHKKEDLMDGEDLFWEKRYPTYIVNKALSSFPECLLYANEMNMHPEIDKRLQYDFYIHIVRPRKRFSPWGKQDKVKDLDVVKQYYGYSNEKAKQALRILSPTQLDYIKSKLNKGGKRR